MHAYDPVSVRDDLVQYLREQYLGPASGEEEIVQGRPDRIYLVGTLYPRGRSAERIDGSVLGDVLHDEELDEPVELANAWHPASAAISFLHDAVTLRCTVTAAVYEPEVPDGGEGGRDRWRRRRLMQEPVEVSADTVAPVKRQNVLEDRARLVSVWRPVGARWLVTVALENLAEHDEADSPPPTEQCLFQVDVRCEALGGSILPYPSSQELSADEEDEELRLLYRERRAYGVGHGCSVIWESGPDGTVTVVATDMLPATVVPAVRAKGLSLPILDLARLADETLPVDRLCAELSEFVLAYEEWIGKRETEAKGLEERYQLAAERLLERMRRAAHRMREGIQLLGDDKDQRPLLAFRLANAAMREQMLQSRHVRKWPGSRGAPLPARQLPAAEPAWHPFQLGFQLLSLASTALDTHDDRETVDLIWFPTGGGKTEAYLGLAAFEMIRRRLYRGIHGGGTAVLTRYTLRLLTAQQFQRAATLICALEQLRETRPELRNTPPFSIGLWVGGETTPNSFQDAHQLTIELRKAQEPESPFQIQSCPWCGSPLLPSTKQQDSGAYGVRTTKHSFELFCPHAECPFHSLLPVCVVDEQMFQDPPTLLVATVDKLARLPWVTDAGSLFGLGNVPYDPPSLVIQDELHLLSGPLGTTVALYEAAVQNLIGWQGSRPKVVASTATIRAADHQVRGLFGSKVALFPPSGLTADNSFFAETDHDAPGRLYLGLMPQAHTQAFATVLTCVALLQAPRYLGLEGDALDAYWSVVAYHNSLRELGRTVTIARDDVESMLRARDNRDRPSRSLRRDGVVELTSNVSANQLPKLLARLERPVQHPEAIDLVATTNMLSVGIDISRLGLMLMNGQPKTTSEYIQATSRVGRANVPGLVVTLLRASKPRDRSHYEAFRAYHQALYRYVEPTSVTPWSLASRRRSLPAALVLLVRHGAGLRANDEAGDFRADDPLVRVAVEKLCALARKADPDEAQQVETDLRQLVDDWEHRSRRAEELGERLSYDSKNGPALLKDFGEQRDGWALMHSMRSVDRQVRVVAVGESL
ncbi:helicase-related protein [Verrucosispora sp. WMMA2044]|uniref:helicase-related protein n=1 Tax=Verrucosispora sp. WMMA2044 TaxID=3016419 RepID=UPI00248CDD02|nr:helicase-related protein [Verrucosispora sp. WMMA2044]WBB47438.1 helicase-related protein [Verrucosispora sp. WMMA2044]